MIKIFIFLIFFSGLYGVNDCREIENKIYSSNVKLFANKINKYALKSLINIFHPRLKININKIKIIKYKIKQQFGNINKIYLEKKFIIKNKDPGSLSKCPFEKLGEYGLGIYPLALADMQYISILKIEGSKEKGFLNFIEVKDNENKLYIGMVELIPWTLHKKNPITWLKEAKNYIDTNKFLLAFISLKYSQILTEFKGGYLKFPIYDDINNLITDDLIKNWENKILSIMPLKYSKNIQKIRFKPASKQFGIEFEIRSSPEIGKFKNYCKDQGLFLIKNTILKNIENINCKYVNAKNKLINSFFIKKEKIIKT